MRKISGFTIIEMMITVMIIGVLASIAIPNYLRQSEIAKCAKGIQTLKILRNAELAYFSENAIFINNQAALNAHVGGNLFAPGNPDWTFAIASANNSQLQLTANRLRGPHQATSITLTDNMASNIDGQWGGLYPRDDPGNF